MLTAACAFAIVIAQANTHEGKHMYKITAEHMTRARGAHVVDKANGLVIFWEKDETFEGFYTFYCSPDATTLEVSEIQDLVYEQNGGAYAAVEKLTAEEEAEFE